MSYDLPDVVRVEKDGPVRIVRLNRPDQLNAINDELHLGLTRLFPQLSADRDARVGVGPSCPASAARVGDVERLRHLPTEVRVHRGVVVASADGHAALSL